MSADIHNEWESRRPHLWRGDRCERCAMRREWEGAKYPCEGIDAPSERSLVNKRIREKCRREAIKDDPARLEIRREQTRQAVRKFRQKASAGSVGK